MQVYVSGSLAYDRIMDFPGKFSDHLLPDKLHILNVCFMVNGLQERFGGTAGNIAYNMALLGEKPVIVATCGHDFGRYRDWLMKHGLPLHGIAPIAQAPTAGAYITTDRSDNQITAFNAGAMGYASSFDFGKVPAAEALAIISPGSLDDMRDYSRIFKNQGLPYIFDPGQSIPAFSGEDLARMIDGSRILITNDYELEMISRATGLDMAGLLEKTGTVITTLGEQGSVIHTKSGETRIPVVPAGRVLDPTGAGDAYRAGLIKGLSLGRELPEAAAMGATLASFCVEHLGTQEHFFTEEEFWTRHNKLFG